MIRIKDSNVQFDGPRIEIMAELTVAMLVFIKTDPFGLEVGRQMLRELEKKAELIAGQDDAPLIKVSKLNETLKKIKETEAES